MSSSLAVIPYRQGGQSNTSHPTLTSRLASTLQAIFTRQVLQGLITVGIPLTLGLTLGLLAGRFFYLANLADIVHTGALITGLLLFRAALVAGSIFFMVFVASHLILDRAYCEYECYQLRRIRIDESVQHIVKTGEHFNRRIDDNCYLIRNELTLFDQYGEALPSHPKFIIVADSTVPTWIIKRIQSNLGTTPYPIRHDQNLAPHFQSMHAIHSMNESDAKTVLVTMLKHLSTCPPPFSRTKTSKRFELHYHNTRYPIQVDQLEKDKILFVIKYPHNLPAELERVIKLMAANCSSGFLERKTVKLPPAAE